ncbi:hypothetical protein DPMN_121676 [Dreissena polymorpha]|uniref:Uncharacterized protein n=1 Tax=Dreissena polymorpha TaxID=45954 RepID=A0A9D4GU09_DREPO|nr:hypothetical protein DPMN_121676 [Dreissena polymorpha]
MADDEDARSLRSPSPISLHPDGITNTTLKHCYIAHLHPLSTSHLLLDRQHPCKNPSIIVNAMKSRPATPATPLFDEPPAPDPASLLQTDTSTLQDTELLTPNYAPPSPLQDDLRTPALHSNNLQDLPPATPNNDQTPQAHDDLYTIATPTPADNLYTPTPSAKLLRFKATYLLVNDNMPLFPSAKRDWATVEEESVALLPNLLWPPKELEKTHPRPASSGC